MNKRTLSYFIRRPQHRYVLVVEVLLLFRSKIPSSGIKLWDLKSKFLNLKTHFRFNDLFVLWFELDTINKKYNNGNKITKYKLIH